MVPTLTGRVPGVNVKLTILTVLPEVNVPVVELVVFDVEQLIKPTNNAVISIKVIIDTAFFFIYSPRFKFPYSNY